MVASKNILFDDLGVEVEVQLCMSFTEKLVVSKISAKVMNSFKVMQFICKMKSSVMALFSVNLMYSVNLMSVKVMLHCINPKVYILEDNIEGYIASIYLFGLL